MGQLNVHITDDVKRDLLDEVRDWSNETGMHRSQAEVVAAAIRRLREDRQQRKAGADLAASGGAGLVERIMRERTDALAHQIVGKGASTNLGMLGRNLDQILEALDKHDRQHAEVMERLNGESSYLTFLASKLYINEVLIAFLMDLGFGPRLMLEPEPETRRDIHMLLEGLADWQRLAEGPALERFRADLEDFQQRMGAAGESSGR